MVHVFIASRTGLWERPFLQGLSQGSPTKSSVCQALQHALYVVRTNLTIAFFLKTVKLQQLTFKWHNDLDLNDLSLTKESDLDSNNRGLVVLCTFLITHGHHFFLKVGFKIKLNPSYKPSCGKVNKNTILCMKEC